MKKLFMLVLTVGSVSAFASDVQTICGKPELLIKGSVSERQAFGGVTVANSLDYDIRVNGQKVHAAGHEIDLIVVRAAIEAGAELCETIDKSVPFAATRRLHIKY